MDQPYFNQAPFRISLTSVASASASPYNHRHSLGALTTRAFEGFADALAHFQSHGFGPGSCLYESPYPPMPVQTPVSVDFSPRMSIDHQMDTQMEGLQQMDGQDSQSLSDSAEAVTEEVKRRRRERRRAQNRVAQRAFRLRKEETIKEISAKLSEMERELERMEHSNDDLTDQISALQRKIRSLERENEELKARFPSISSAGSTPLSTAFPSGRQSFSKGNDAAAMANGCF